MFNAAGTSKDRKISISDAETQKQTPRKNEELTSGTPRLGNKTPASPREKTGKAKELEMAFIDASLRNTPVPLAGSSSGTDGKDDPQGNLAADKSPRVKSIRKNESAAMKSPVISSPYPKPLQDPSRPAPLPPRKIPPLQLPATITDTPPATPVKGSSPRKLTQLLSEKFAAAKKNVETLGSPRNDIADIFEGIEWQEFSEIDTDLSTKNLQPPLARAPLPEASLKRKPECEIDREKKKVRFNEDVSTKTFVKPLPEPAREAQPSTSLVTEVERLSRELAQSPEPSHHLGEGDMPHGRPQFQSPPHWNLPKTATKGAQPPSSGDNAAYPFHLSKLAKSAIEARLQGQSWLGKATGDSIAASLQLTLETLMQANPTKIKRSVYVCLQQLFGLLPAGATQNDGAFRYALEQSVVDVGLNVGEWSDIDKLHQQFDELDVRAFPEEGAEFKRLLGKIIETRNKLLAGKGPVREKAEKGSDA